LTILSTNVDARLDFEITPLLEYVFLEAEYKALVERIALDIRRRGRS
jgi:hypothetical protein